MNNFERQQDQDIFFTAGKDSFKLAVHFSDNPYKEKPFFQLWEKGYRVYKRNWDANLARLKHERTASEQEPPVV